MTLAQKFKDLRAERQMSLADVGKAAGIERTTIWKIENGQLPRGATLQKACLRGLGLVKESREWEELQALWTAERTGQAVTAQSLAGQLAMNHMAGNREFEDFYRTVSELPKEAWAELDKAIRRPAVLKALAALNALYDAVESSTSDAAAAQAAAAAAAGKSKAPKKKPAA
ncbi:MAG: helix-turn-helix domain-containing protein [Candidatus Methylacidiphilales bacterium]